MTHSITTLLILLLNYIFLNATSVFHMYLCLTCTFVYFIYLKKSENIRIGHYMDKTEKPPDFHMIKTINDYTK